MMTKEKRKEYLAENKEKIRKQTKQYRTKNKEKIRKQKADYYEKNKSEILEKQKEYAKTRRERRREKYAENRDEILLNRRTRYNGNKEKYRENSRAVKTRYVYSKSRAKRKNLLFTLTLEQYELMVNAPCYYCGNMLGKKVEAGIGLDRLNNEKGYELGNVVSCCKCCNTIKHEELTPDETKAAVMAILKIREQLNPA